MKRYISENDIFIKKTNYILEKLITAICLALAIYLFIDKYIIYSFKEFPYFDELFSLTNFKINPFAMFYDNIYKRETHPIFFDYGLNIIQSSLNLNFQTLRLLISAINFASFYLFYNALKNKKVHLLIICFILLVFVGHNHIHWWLFQIRSYALQVFFFILCYFLREKIQNSTNNLNLYYIFSLIALGSIHYTTLIIASFIILLEDKNILNLKRKLWAILLFTPNYLSLGILLYQERFSPKRISHYPEINVNFIKEYYFSIFENIHFVILAGLFISIIKYFLSKKTIKSNKENTESHSFITIFFLKRIIKKHLLLITPMIVTILCLLFSIITNKKILHTHTIITIYPAAYLLFGEVFNHISSTTKKIIITMAIFLGVRPIISSQYYKSYCSSCFSKDLIIQSSKKESPEIYIGCLYNIGDLAFKKINKLYDLNLNQKQFMKICQKEELEEKTEELINKNMKYYIIKEGYSFDINTLSTHQK